MYRPVVLRSPHLLVLTAAIASLLVAASVVRFEYRENIATTDSLVASVIDRINTERTAVGVAPLVEERKLNLAADTKQSHMIENNYWEHTAPDGATPWDFVRAEGIEYAAAAENLARGFTNPTDVVDGWMNSPEHRAAMLNARFTRVGIGMNYVNDKYDAVALFVEPVSSIAAAGSVLSDSTVSPQVQAEVSFRLPDAASAIDATPQLLLQALLVLLSAGFFALLPVFIKDASIPPAFKKARQFHEQPMVHISLYAAIGLFVAGSHLL